MAKKAKSWRKALSLHSHVFAASRAATIAGTIDLYVLNGRQRGRSRRFISLEQEARHQWLHQQGQEEAACKKDRECVCACAFAPNSLGADQSLNSAMSGSHPIPGLTKGDACFISDGQ